MLVIGVPANCGLWTNRNSEGNPGELDGLEGSASELKSRMSFADRPTSVLATQLETNSQHAEQWTKEIENENKG